MTISKSLTIIQMNDSHAYLNLPQELFWNGDHAEYRKAGGYARIAAILKQVREDRPGQVLAFDGGDTIRYISWKNKNRIVGWMPYVLLKGNIAGKAIQNV